MSSESTGADSGRGQGQGPEQGDSCADHDHHEHHDHGGGGGDCMADALRAQIAAQVAAEQAAGGEATAEEDSEACPMPSEATDFLHWPWLWRFAQFLFMVAVSWQFWPAAGKLSRVLLYAATAFTMAASWVQMARSSGGAPVKGSWLSRWRQAVLGWPEKFSGPLWVFTAIAIGLGFWIASRSARPDEAGRSLNAFVEKADMLLIGLVGFVQFRFTVARRQPFWLMGVIAESWLIGLTSLCAVFVGSYALRTGWPGAARLTDSAATAAGPLSGWMSGYGTAFSHLAVVAGLLAVSRAVGDPLWWTLPADPVTAARIKGSRLVLLMGNLVFAVVSVVKWQSAPLQMDALSWPQMRELSWTSTVYAESFGHLPPRAVMGALVGCVGVFAWLTWRALGQRLAQLAPRSKQPLADAAAALAGVESAPGWRAWAWMALPLLATAAALAATQKKLAWMLLGAGLVAMVWLARRARLAALRTMTPAPLALAAARPAPPAGTEMLSRGQAGMLLTMGGLFAIVLLGLGAVKSDALQVSQGYRRVWWQLAWEQIETRPGGHGFGSEIYRREFQATYRDTEAGRARLQAAIPDRLHPQLEPGWGPLDWAYHVYWLTWELSRGFDTHNVLLQALFEGGIGWLLILGLAGLTAVGLRGGFKLGPSLVLDGLVLALGLLCFVDVASGSLEKMAACIIAAWVAWGVQPAAAARVSEHP